MRGLFTSGILDVMMENGIEFDGLVGVSAGAAFGCNYKSRQPGRGLRYNIRFAHDPRFSGWRSWLTTGNIFNAEFCYHTIPHLYDIFDIETYDNNPMEFHVVCTDVNTGQAVYQQLPNAGDECFEWIRASSSLPLVSRVVEVGGRQLLDGGLVDSVPLRYFQQLGFDRNIVILTRPDDYTKEPLNYQWVLKLLLHRYPHIVRAMSERHEIYNQQVNYARKEAADGHILLLQPDSDLGIPHICHNPLLMRQVYNRGRYMAISRLDEIRQFLGLQNAKS